MMTNTNAWLEGTFLRRVAATNMFALIKNIKIIFRGLKISGKVPDERLLHGLVSRVSPYRSVLYPVSLARPAPLSPASATTAPPPLSSRMVLSSPPWVNHHHHHPLLKLIY